MGAGRGTAGGGGRYVFTGALVVRRLLDGEGEGRRGRGVLEGVTRGDERQIPGEAELLVGAGGNGAIARIETLRAAPEGGALERAAVDRTGGGPAGAASIVRVSWERRPLLSASVAEPVMEYRSAPVPVFSTVTVC